MTKLTLFLLCLTIVLSPLYVVRWSYFGQFPTTLLELLVWLTTGAWVISKLTVHDLNLKLDQSLRWPVVIITTAVLISTLIAQDRWAALGILRAYFLEPFVIYFIAVDLFSRLKHFQFSTLNSQFSIPQLIWLSLLTAGIWLSLLGITQFLFHWPVFTAHQLDRAHGVFNNGNALALFLGPITAVLALKVVRKFNAFSFFILTLLLTAFLMTKSTGGILGLLGTLGVFGLFRATGLGKHLRLLFAIGCLLFVIFLTQISHFTPTTDNPWVRTGGTAQVRLCLWEGTARLLSDQPIFGAGLTGFQAQYAAHYHTCDAEPLVYPHSILLNFWSELSVLGLLGFLALFWVVLSKPTNMYTPAFVYIFLHGLVDVPYFKNDLALVFWVLLALWAFHSERLTLTRSVPFRMSP